MRTAVVAWVVAAIFYFYQYVLRSAPSVMMPQLSEAFGISSLGMASILGLFYYGYSPFSLVAGTAMDRLGPRSVLPDRRGRSWRGGAAVRHGPQRLWRVWAEYFRELGEYLRLWEPFTSRPGTFRPRGPPP